MATYTRNNAWNNGGDFSNSDLLWYAKGMGKMMGRALADPASWWFYAAIHGEYVNPATPWYEKPEAFPDWKFLVSPPKVPIAPLPTQAIQDLYWNQCQHQSWYFLPWHRGYLLALEAQLRQDIVSLGGPATWALPYWNYFGGVKGSQYHMPPAFAEKTLPNSGGANPLYVNMRYGPDANRKIYIPTPAGIAAHPGDPNYSIGTVTDDCLKNDIYTGHDLHTKPPGFGGPKTPFWHGGNTSGNLENNPHNLLHVYVGGQFNQTLAGLMSDPGLAALDPIFYLHHANIDRMWAIWNASGNSNPTDPGWLNGPAPRKFVMPGLDAKPWHYTPKQMSNLSALDYTYQELPAVPAKISPLTQRLAQLGAPLPTPAEEKKSKQADLTLTSSTELLGASEHPLRIQGRVTQTAVKLDAGVNNKLIQSLAAPSLAKLPDNVYLKLENVRGTSDATVLGVYVNLPQNAELRDSRKFLAGHVALFGLRRASVGDGAHGGGGLTFLLDITPVIDELHVAKTLDVSSLTVSIVPSAPLPENADITVGRVSIYREAQQNTQ